MFKWTGLDVTRYSGTLHSGLPEMRTFSEQKEGTQCLNAPVNQVLILLGTVELSILDSLKCGLSDYPDKRA